MTAWTVSWQTEAFNELERAWDGTRLREASVGELDPFHSRLRTDPLEFGESRGGTLRVEFMANIAVFSSLDFGN